MKSYTMKKFKCSLLAASVMLAALFPSVSSAARLDAEMNRMFDAMSNVTASGNYKSITRVGYTGGGFMLRGKLMSLSAINIQLPSASGGCGGIDLFGGSFTFINAQEFVQLLRSIAANAAGLIFKLALNAMDAVLEGSISQLQELIQKLNNLTANSCQLAKGLLVDAASAFGNAAKTSVGNQLSSEGITDQFHAMWGTSSGAEDPIVKKASSGKRKACDDYGNILWCMLDKGNFDKIFLFNGDKNKQKELLLSITGTIVFPEKVETDSSGDSKDNSKDFASILDFESLFSYMIDGTESFDFYKCKNKDTCTEMISQSEKNFKGVSQKIIEKFVEGDYFDNSKEGKYPSDSDMKFANLINNYGNGFIKYADDIAKINPALAKQFVLNMTPKITYSFVYNYLNSMLTSAKASLNTKSSNSETNSIHYKEIEKKISDKQNELTNFYATKTAGDKSNDPVAVIQAHREYMTSLKISNSNQPNENTGN